MKAAAALAAVLTASLAFAGADEIVCEGEYDGHLQGVATDGKAIYWSHTKTVVKTDLDGRVLRSVRAPSHQGDLCVRSGVLYVAVNLGKFNTHAQGDSWVFAYDAETLQEKRRWRLPDAVHGAGGIAAANGRFYVIGGLPLDIEQNFVYEYTSDFKLVKRHVLATGFTHMGIQTAAFEDGRFLFGIYGGKGNPGGAIECPPTLDAFVRRTGPGAVGILKLNGEFWTGGVFPGEKNPKLHRGKIVRRHGFPVAEKAYRPATGRGSVRIFYEGRDTTGWTDAGYRFDPDGNGPLFAPRNAQPYVPARRVATTTSVPAVGIGGARAYHLNDCVRGVRRVAETGELLAFHVPGTPETLSADPKAAATIKAIFAEAVRLGVRVR